MADKQDDGKEGVYPTEGRDESRKGEANPV